jgi:hypothetical protein
MMLIGTEDSKLRQSIRSFAMKVYLSVRIKRNGLNSPCSNHVLDDPVRVAGIESSTAY